jgi:enoyl-CoA hydratase
MGPFALARCGNHCTLLSQPYTRTIVQQEVTLPDYHYITYETLEVGTIVRVMLNRPEVRNAQNRGLLVELNDALLRAEADDAVRVVILGGIGPIFSSGHDLGSKDALDERVAGPSQHPSYSYNGGTRAGAEARMLQEWHYFYENTKRWRNLRKITLAQVQGTVYAAGLMLIWACDLIVASDDARFADVVGTRLGMCGVEYFAHPWELGPRKAKELMLTGDSIDVHEAHALGMVSKVFPVDQLSDRTMDLARRIARLPTVTALLIKESVNQTVENMGFSNALQACFSLHQLNHSHWAEVHEGGAAAGLPEDGIVDWHTAGPVLPARIDRPS